MTALGLFFWLTALILIATSILKFWAVATDPFVALKVELKISAICLIALIELIISITILLSKSVGFKIVLIGSTFSVFWLRSFWNFLDGNAGCLCFGGFIQSPLVSLLVDGIVLTVVAGIVISAWKHGGLASLFDQSVIGFEVCTDDPTMDCLQAGHRCSNPTASTCVADPMQNSGGTCCCLGVGNPPPACLD